MKKNKMIIGSTMIMMAIGLAACGKSNSASETSNNGTTKPINWMASAEITTLDPSKIVDAETSNTALNAEQGLLTYGDKGKLENGIAKSYDVSKDGKTYTFHLRDNAKWSDGSKVTANDFVYGIQRTVNPKTAAQNTYDFDHIVNYEAVSKGQMSYKKLGVSAPNDKTVVFKLSNPQPYFKYLVAGTDFLPQKQSFVESKGNKYGTNSENQIYDGPFKVTGWTGTNDTWMLEKNDNYWDAKSTKLEKIKINVEKDANTAYNEYQSGQLDEMMLADKEQVKYYKGTPEFHQLASARNNYLEFNEDRIPAFKNVNIRKALSMVVNRDQFVNDVMGDGSFPAKGLVSTGMMSRNGVDFADAAYVKDAATYNKKKALYYWNKGMKEIGKKSLTFNILFDDTSEGKSITEFLQSSAFSQLPGLKVTATNIPTKARLSRQIAYDYDATVTGWSTTYPDPISFLQLLTSTYPYNFARWKNAEYDKYVNAASTTDANNSAKRWDDMVKAEKILMNDQGAVPFYQSSEPQVVKTNIKNVTHSATGLEWNFSKAYVEK
ncbi:Oligopeptide-binding protein OppA [Apilactobacillus kunkeei]|uniref:peptide ABC transporter substrate-binding protein n=1 Tax=Apilactobacillus kunkeei TaxID=148814 RepID=UPI0021E24312|nr:Oligopeptide-binding protein OppA [Apilactobacillus kunkeei]